MKIQLIEGKFNAGDALNLITQMIHIKVRYHENKISTLSNEEDIKNGEAKIKRLQKELYELRNQIISGNKKYSIDAAITIE